MKRIIPGACCILFAAALSAQTPAQSTAKPMGLGKTEAVTNEDSNIRAYIELLRTDLRDSKSRIVGEVMQLDADKASKFWPIYKEFESEYSRLGDRILATIKDYAANCEKMTDGAADRMANQVMDIELLRNTLKKKYYERVKEGVGAITAMRFLQVENQLERIYDLQIAAQLPVVR